MKCVCHYPPKHQTAQAIFKLSTLSVGILLGQLALAQQLQTTATDAVVELETIKVDVKKTNRYQKGKKQQFDNNVVTIYKDKDEVERFKGVNPADLLSGIAGVHSSDARNNGAISPNVRGLQGEGRVPVVVDGTRSEYTVYRGYAGVNNRTYVDPNLISEVKAYKGATELEHGMPHAVGGAVILNTIDAKDVIPEGKNWGVDVKYETNNNSVKPRFPDIKYGERFDTPENHWAIFGDANPELYIPLKNKGKGGFFRDHALRVAVAAKSDLTDLMVAYSDRQQGNYFSGSRKAESYYNRFDVDDVLGFADFSPPGHETPNTSSKNKSWLIKNSWYLPKDQQLDISWRNSDLEYGEIMNSRSSYSHIIKQAFDYGENSNIGVQWTPAKVKQQAGRIDYKINPKDNDWLDLKAGIWYSKTNSQNNSSGGPIAAVAGIDGNYDFELMQMFLNSNCVKSEGFSLGDTQKFDVSCKITNEHLESARQAYKDYTGYDFPNANEYLKIINPATHKVQTTHRGLDISNKMQLTPTLDLTVGMNIHTEKQTGEQGEMPKYCGGQGYDVNGKCKGAFLSHGYIFPPKTGERAEQRTWFSFNWQPTEKLNINVGGRWGRYSLEDKDADDKILRKELSRGRLLNSIKYSALQDVTEEEKKYLTDNKIVCGYNHFYGHGYGYCQDEQGSEDLAEKKAIKFLDENGYASDTYERRQIFDVIDGSSKTWKLKPWEWKADDKGRLHAENAPFALLKPNQRFNGASETYKEQSEEEKYQPVGKKTDRAFDPSVAISYQFNPVGRVYARYAQATRFASLYEGVSGFSDGRYQKTIDSRDFVPEQARNLEIGVVQDLRSWLPQFQQADIKLNYYHNNLKNVIDRSDYDDGNFFSQYDSLKTRGIELQARFDQGRVFADLGYSYLIKSEMCDKTKAYQAYFSDFYPREGHTIDTVPYCFTGGFPEGYLRGAIPPKHSVALNIGSRWLDDRLVLGSRIVHQSSANNKKQQQEGWADKRALNSYPWKSYTILDAYVDYKPTNNMTLSLIGTNLTNIYHPDTLTRTHIGAPGRTIKFGFNYKF